jgi:hypothetical protein
MVAIYHPLTHPNKGLRELLSELSFINKFVFASNSKSIPPMKGIYKFDASVSATNIL